MGSRNSGYLLVMTAAILWGTTGTAQALGHPLAQPVAVGTLRVVVAGAVFLLLAPFRGSLRRPRRSELPWVALGALLVLAYQLSFFAAVRSIGVAVGTVLQIGVAPLTAGLLGALVLKERVNLGWLMATAIGIAGMVMVTIRPEIGGPRTLSSAAYLLGALLAMGAGVAYAGFSLALRQLGQTMGTIPAATIVFAAGGVISIPVALAHDLSWLASAPGAISILHLGVVATAVAYLLFTRGIRLVHFGSAITATLVEGVTATLLGTLLLGERLTLVQGAGILLVLAAVWMSGRSTGRAARAVYQA